jgi:hypothetical protein
MKKLILLCVALCLTHYALFSKPENAPLIFADEQDGYDIARKTILSLKKIEKEAQAKCYSNTRWALLDFWRSVHDPSYNITDEPGREKLFSYNLLGPNPKSQKVDPAIREVIQILLKVKKKNENEQNLKSKL